MKTNHKAVMRGAILSQATLLSAIMVAGCGPTVFQGQAPISVVGTLPAPPPAPPPPPPEPEKRVKLEDNKITITEKIQFEYNSSNILEVSHSLLNEVAEVIKGAPRIKKLQIEGHASSEGNDDYNMRLSEGRAKAVKAYLVGQGIPETKLVAKGFGETKPIASNDTEEGREKNRRVEFNIIEQDYTVKKVEIDPTTGEKKVVEEKQLSTGAGN